MAGKTQMNKYGKAEEEKTGSEENEEAKQVA